MVVCELDPLRDEAVAYVDKLKEANGVVELIEIKGAIHTFDFFPCTLSDDFYLKQVSILKNTILTIASAESNVNSSFRQRLL